MKKAQGFTLVELLVVIVIMGILATGSVSMFTGAQQKARDSVRITDIQAVKLSLEQAYGDEAEYPPAEEGTAEAKDGLQMLLDNGYIDKIPEDPKSEEANNETCFVYVYGVADDASTSVQAQEFELSTAFENSGNTESKSEEDKGNDPFRWETGINTDHVNTSISTGKCDAEYADSTNTYAGANDDAPYVIDYFGTDS